MEERSFSVERIFQLWWEQEMQRLSDREEPSLLEICNLAEQIHGGGGKVPDTEVMHHILSCPRCLNILSDSLKAVEESKTWDVVLLHSASAGEESPVRAESVDGVYIVTIRRSLSGDSSVLLTVEVTPSYSKELEGKTIEVRGGDHRILLEGTIVSGSVLKVIKDERGIYSGPLTVRVKDEG